MNVDEGGFPILFLYDNGTPVNGVQVPKDNLLSISATYAKCIIYSIMIMLEEITIVIAISK
ncbi:hypothetical protein KXD40_001362 [Peronospora effusa]|uniref:Uncharacterized protein n=1 Tax=Peronospora effusa TaxID=542832 RepID=A0A3M6VTD1_9STRA|nr:hypothetical protein DD238_000279 [Peronospora effusa]RQM08980.1 hypothetical protein DD237_000463 [Peronospora effusa]UIZ21491.1 hypothetical protein KXD40_001362 [Peronospora effusa]